MTSCVKGSWESRKLDSHPVCVSLLITADNFSGVPRVSHSCVPRGHIVTTTDSPASPELLFPLCSWRAHRHRWEPQAV